MIEKIKKRFPFLSRMKSSFMIARKSRILIKNKDQFLHRLCKFFDNNNYTYWLEYGTMLGAVRDHKIISHDYDIDISILQNEWTLSIRKELAKMNIFLIKEFRVDGEVIEETYDFNGINLDIFYSKLINNNLMTPIFRPFDNFNWKESIQKYGGVELYYFINEFDGFISIDLESLKMKIPKNYHSHLISYYGDNYMIPIPNWKGENDAIPQKKVGSIIYR
ncbi:LicD family protein [Xenorhabdus miraniensis]|uniref:LicD/FKTN/FKRP nucleotidyltransferase domain-containing protein n=1 Tax=Xenorhabdus miraniensis TaxID=351674 RepID=A0A2D0JLN8_9GAMM|nr:LicD family protein [Xenorhabdus miraniensis]PHM47220.1 hypothetical protein Xmir_03433 [Xenorhabdus miraniensis]